MTATNDKHAIGSIVTATYGNGMQRKVRVLAYDNDGLVFVSYPEYNLPNEWIRETDLP